MYSISHVDMDGTWKSSRCNRVYIDCIICLIVSDIFVIVNLQSVFSSFACCHGLALNVKSLRSEVLEVNLVQHDHHGRAMGHSHSFESNIQHRQCGSVHFHVL